MSKEIYFLVKQSKKGNKKAQLKLYDLHCKAMFIISCRYLKDKEVAKDAMQDAFLKAFINLSRFSSKSNFSAWLKTIVIHTCIDQLKKKKLNTISMENFPLEIVEDDNWSMDSRISRVDILEAMDTLPLKYQLVVKFYLLEGYNHQEISEILKIPIATSKTRLRRGKLILKQLLKAKYYGT